MVEWRPASVGKEVYDRLEELILRKYNGHKQGLYRFEIDTAISTHCDLMEAELEKSNK